MYQTDYASDLYKDGNGKVIQSKIDLICWLALSADISVQHMRYQDIVKDMFQEQKCILMTKEEFTALKYEQESNCQG